MHKNFNFDPASSSLNKNGYHNEENHFFLKLIQ